jgi:outer membrane receptor for ferrienterochelin and colicins
MSHCYPFKSLARRCGAVVLLALLGAAAPASAQSSLPDLNIEELMKLDGGQVFGASERLQPVTEAPSSVSFVTAEDIRRHGYRTLAEILRGVRGLYVTDDRNFSFIGARGFGKPGDYNSRILLLINGHRVNDNVFGQAEIGAEFGLDPATFERVEIIRGPASSQYGDSAFFAVINVITKTGASINGGALTGEIGTLGARMSRASAGRRFANGVDLAVSATLSHSDGNTRLYFPEFDAPETNHGVAENLDAEDVRQFYSRLSFDKVRVTAAYGSRTREVPTASFGTIFNEQAFPEQTTDRHTLVDAEYVPTIRGTKAAFRVSFDQFSYDGDYPVAGDEIRPLLLGRNTVVGSRWSASARGTRTLPGRQIFTVGAEFIDNLRQDQSSGYLDSPRGGVREVLFVAPRSSRQHAVYFQDEIRIKDSIILNGGLRYDGYEQFTRVTPRVALIVLPSASQSFKYLFGRAFRAPNAYERTTFYFGDSVERLQPESIDTHELVWERYFNDALRTSVSTYWYKAERLLTLVADDTTFLGARYVNAGEVHASGLEFEGQLRIASNAQAHFSYSLQRTEDQDTQTELPNSPRHMAKGRVSFPGPSRGSSIGVEGLFMSSRQTVLGSRLSAAGTVNLTATQPLGRSWELSVSARNLFDVTYADPASSAHQQDAITRNGRTARIGLTWKFWKP